MPFLFNRFDLVSIDFTLFTKLAMVSSVCLIGTLRIWYGVVSTQKNSDMNILMRQLHHTEPRSPLIDVVPCLHFTTSRIYATSSLKQKEKHGRFLNSLIYSWIISISRSIRLRKENNIRRGGEMCDHIGWPRIRCVRFLMTHDRDCRMSGKIWVSISNQDRTLVCEFPHIICETEWGRGCSGMTGWAFFGKWSKNFWKTGFGIGPWMALCGTENFAESTGRMSPGRGEN